MLESIGTLTLTKEQWLKERKRGIGASEVAAVLGISRWKTPLQLYEEKVSADVIQEPENAAMHFGLKLEDVIADEFAEQTGMKVRRDNKIRIHPLFDFLFCSLDRTIVTLDDRGPGVLEIKTASGWYARTWDTEVPVEYFAQIQHQLAVTGYQWGQFAVLVDGRDYKSFEVRRDEEYITEQTEALVKWWNGHVVPRIPPPATVVDFDGMSSLPESIVEASAEIRARYDQLVDVRSKIARLDAEKELHEGAIKEFMGTRELLSTNGQPLCTWKTSKPFVSIDSKRLKKELPDVAAKYSIEKPGSRRFLVKGAKEEAA